MRVETLFLQESAQRFPDKVALVAGSERVTYAALAERPGGSRPRSPSGGGGPRRPRGRRLSQTTASRRVVAVSRRSPPAGCSRSSTRATKADKLAFIIGNLPARGASSRRRSSRASPPRRWRARRWMLQARAPVPARIVVGDAERGSRRDRLRGRAREATPRRCPARASCSILAMLVYTSGSTGFPQGRDDDGPSERPRRGDVRLDLSRDERRRHRAVRPASISFDYGLYQVLMSVLKGATLVIEKGLHVPAGGAQPRRRGGRHVLPLVSTMAALVLRIARPRAPARIRRCGRSRTPRPRCRRRTSRSCRRCFPATRLFSMYGLTECKRCTCLPPAELARRPDFRGRRPFLAPRPGSSTGRPPARPRETGELVIRGPHVMAGYWENPEATAKALRPGPYPWERVLYTETCSAPTPTLPLFVARKDDIIKTRGEKVSPKRG